jgi:hypothetical protein
MKKEKGADVKRTPITVQATGFVCQNCGHFWVPRPRHGMSHQPTKNTAVTFFPATIPKLCPHCKSTTWTQQRDENGKRLKA